MRAQPRVYVYANAGADDERIAGPLTTADAKQLIASRDDEGGRIAYFTIPASRVEEYEQTHSVRHTEEA